MAGKSRRAEQTARAKSDTLGVIRGVTDDGRGGALDRVIHERVRLAIVSALAVNDKLTFGELRDIVGTSDGNLSVHARRLEEVEYVKCRKFFHGRVPKTEFKLTAAGRRALERYLDHMEALAKATRGGSGE